MEYRRLWNAEAGEAYPWHWRKNCAFWPTGEVWETTKELPYSGELCPECARLAKIERSLVTEPEEPPAPAPPPPPSQGICFVMLPLNDRAQDTRFEDTLEHAIRRAGLTPFRGVVDPRVGVVIREIEDGIREARACLADVTQDDPHVWYELGFARACEQPVLLLCSKGRVKLPFDMQFWHVIEYDAEAEDSGRRLEREITRRLKALLKRDFLKPVRRKKAAKTTKSTTSTTSTKMAGTRKKKTVGKKTAARKSPGRRSKQG